MHSDDDEQGLLKRALVAACGVIITLCGVVVGLWSHGMELTLTEIRESQRAIWRVIGERASLPGRTAELEKRTDDQERRLRDVELRTGRK